MSQSNDTGFRSYFLAKREDLMRGLYTVCGIDLSVPLDEVAFTASRREICDVIRQYTQDKYKTFRVKPILTDHECHQCMQGTLVMIQYYAEFAGKNELNQYKLKYQQEYAETKAK